MASELRLIALAEIDDHPDNPRLAFRDDVIDSIVANLGDEYPQKHAVHVRPTGERFQLTSGHHRKRAAIKKGFADVWAWVEDSDDATAFMELATSNSQGELSPLEIGLHALKAVPKAQGKKGSGIATYAERIGKTKQYVGQLRDAAEVLMSLTCKVDFTSYLDKAQHLAAIHKAPRETWETLAAALIERGLNVADTEETVGEVSKAAERIAPEWQAVFLDITSVAQAIASKQKTAGTFERLANKAADIRGFIEDNKDKLPKKCLKDFLAWLAEYKGGSSWEIAALQKYHNDLIELVAPVGKFALLLADPPWQYDFAETDNRQIENQYATMTVEEICQLEPPSRDDCMLFLWATAPKLREALQVIDAWGFEYKTHAIWDKQKIGMGYWFRGQHELLLVATRGDVSPPEQSLRVPSLFSSARTGHSEKPACVYEMLEAMFPELSEETRCEMFARQRRDGWAAWGNEV
jgi:N6-adenosine-specific RNA methylase IME4/ParB-like chromosome segregation protein Spo0J